VPLELTPIRSIRAAFAAVLCVLGCSDLPEIRYETEHLRIGIAFDPPLCRGNIDYYERVVTTLEQQLGTRVREPIEVYLWDDPSSFPESGWCAEWNGLGCYKNGAVFASFLSIEHELVHAVIDTFARPTPFWNEGAAEALSFKRTYFGNTAPVDNLDLDPPWLRYSTAGHFSRWLIETYGLDLYRKLLRTRGSSRAAFESTYDMSVEAAQELYFAQAPHAYGASRCPHLNLPQTGDLEWSETINVDCSSADTWGDSRAIGVFRVLTISERGFYELTTSAEVGAIAPCFDEDLESPVLLGDPAYGDVPPASGGFLRVFTGDQGKSTLDLIPGRYELTAAYAGYEARTVGLAVRAATGPIPQTPESAG
jgi:hypothetical protein